MNKYARKAVSAILLCAMIFSVSACKKSNSDEDSSSDYSSQVDAGQSNISSDGTGSNDQSSTQGNSQSSNQSTTQSKKQNTSKSENSQITNAQGTTNNNQGSKTSLSWAQVKAQIPAKLKGTTITFYNWNPANSATGSVQAISNFTKETGIKVNWVTGTYDDYNTKITAMVASNKAPDIVRLRDSNVNIIKSLQPITNLGYNFNDDAWNHQLMDLYKVNGNNYTMILKNTPYFQPFVMYYNRTLISRFKLEDPYKLWKSGKWTWNKMASMCADFVEAAGDDYEGYTMPDGGEYMRCMGVSYITYDPAKSQYVSHMSDPRIVKAWQFVSKNVKSANFSNTVYNLEGFEAGSILFHANSTISARTTHFHFKKLKANGELGTVPMPVVDGQKTYYQELCENEAYGVPKGAKNASAVPYFLRYYLDAANYNMDKFYYDEQAKEVANWCKNQTFFTQMEVLVAKQQYGNSVHDMSYKLRQTDAAQIKTTLDQYASMINKCVKDNNDAIKKMK